MRAHSSQGRQRQPSNDRLLPLLGYLAALRVADTFIFAISPDAPGAWPFGDEIRHGLDATYFDLKVLEGYRAFAKRSVVHETTVKAQSRDARLGQKRTSGNCSRISDDHFFACRRRSRLHELRTMMSNLASRNLK